MSSAPVLEPSDLPTSPPRVNRYGQIDVAKALRLRLEHGLSYEEIGVHLCPTNPFKKQSIKDALERFGELVKEPGLVRAYCDSRATTLGALELQLMQSLADPKAIRKASLNNRAYAFQQIHTARRLEEGKSTENVSVLAKVMGQAFERIHGDQEDPATTGLSRVMDEHESPEIVESNAVKSTT
jgi:hypothetical protein